MSLKSIGDVISEAGGIDELFAPHQGIKDPANPWMLSRIGGQVTLEHRTNGYWIPVDEIRTATEAWDWICQLAEKSWITPEALGYLAMELTKCIGRVR